MNFMYNIAAMGDWDSIYGFGALGISTFPVTDEKEGAQIFKKLCDGDYGIIYMTEALAETLKSDVDKVREKMLPAVILIPGISENTGRGMESVKESVVKAVGSDIIFGD